MHAKSLQSCLTCDPTDCSPPGSSVHGNPSKEYWNQQFDELWGWQSQNVIFRRVRDCKWLQKRVLVFYLILSNESASPYLILSLWTDNCVHCKNNFDHIIKHEDNKRKKLLHPNTGTQHSAYFPLDIFSCIFILQCCAHSVQTILDPCFFGVFFYFLRL